MKALSNQVQAPALNMGPSPLGQNQPNLTGMQGIQGPNPQIPHMGGYNQGMQQQNQQQFGATPAQQQWLNQQQHGYYPAQINSNEKCYAALHNS